MKINTRIGFVQTGMLASKGMKKKHRKGGGKDSSGGKGRSGSSRTTEKEESSATPGTGSAAGSQQKRPARRQIRNARGLRDVLGLGDDDRNRRPAQSGAITPRGSSSGGPRPVRRDKNSPIESSARPTAARTPISSSSNEPTKPSAARAALNSVTNTLKYIMNFQPPQPTPAPAVPPKSFDRAISKVVRPPVDSGAHGKARSGGKSARTGGRPSGKSSAPVRRSDERGKSKDRNADRPTNRGGNSGESRGSAKATESVRPTRNSGRGRNPDRAERGKTHDRPPERSPGRQSERATSSPATNSDRVTGMVKRHPDGFGFLIPDDRTLPDIYISRQSMTGVMTNDKVEARVYKPKTASSKAKGKDGEARLAGEILKVVSHSNSRIVGKYLPVDQKYGVILDENRGWGADLRIASQDSMSAKEGDMVAVEVIQYPGDNQEFIGKVVSVLGSIDEPLNDVIRIIHTAGIPNEFSKTALADARSYGAEVTPAEMRDREDLTALNLITIDGATARDFDDAVYVEQTATGFRLIVAIADVSHYVKPGTALDKEAYERGTSTYFPNFVNPMLPEELSNELCSLKPNVKRLCFACEIMINFNGEIEKYRFFEAVMLSKARVIYGEAQEVIDGNTPPRLRPVEQNILRAADLAKILMQKRFREGSLDLEIPETQVVVDSVGVTVDILKSERLFAHRLIEELMLVTNICTARFLEEHNMPGIYRVHDEPDPDAIMNLQRYMWNLGGSKSMTGGTLQKKLTKALESMQGKPESQILNILTLRTMRQAQYSSTNVGHFGLGFAQYSHFTSPIRRYPDLIAHRLIKSELYQKYRHLRMNEDDLASATTFLSGTEQRSVKAERQLISIKKARFIAKFIDQEFDGIISSVTKFGVFVLLRQYDVDGLVKIENLGPDKFNFDDENLRLLGARTGLRYCIGDAIRVRVKGADPEQGKVDFELAEPIMGAKNAAPEDNPKKGKRLDASKRSSTADDRGSVRKERVSKRRRKN